jgi:hypothetical protein
MSRVREQDLKLPLKRAILISAVLAAFWPGGRVCAQRTGSTTLALHVSPEAHLGPSQVALRFVVTADGIGDISSQTEAIAAWVRALPGQRIRLIARIASLAGPSGTVPIEAVQWSGASQRATGGGRAAACSSGSFAGGTTQDLVAAWQSSGTLICSVTFSLGDPHSLPPGVYTGAVDLTLRAE